MVQHRMTAEPAKLQEWSDRIHRAEQRLHAADCGDDERRLRERELRYFSKVFCRALGRAYAIRDNYLVEYASFGGTVQLRGAR